VSIAELLADQRICICVGAGGVGKTTTSAAVALGLAARGRRVALVTIDPSKRLAGALALDQLGNEPQTLSRAHLAPTGIDLRGEVCAMVLDPKRTFDELIEQLAPDEATRDRVLANHIYREISGAIGGSHEFTAVAKLYELDRTGAYDAIVLDTPPSRNTLDFLRAPERLMQFFDAPALRLLLGPAGIGARVAQRTGGLSLIRRLIGVDLLAEISLFFAAVGGLIAGFRAQASAVETLLRDPGTTFVLVTTPEREPVREAIEFGSHLRGAGLTVGQLVVNRTRLAGPALRRAGDQAELERSLNDALGERLGTIVAGSAAREARLAQRDRNAVATLAEGLPGVAQTLVPLLDLSLSELETLGAMTRELFAAEGS
jgi:anion-transporting  ArsA/GET3 family ATPase